MQDHWKIQEFPLARIKKIMRMDEDVRVSVCWCLVDAALVNLVAIFY